VGVVADTETVEELYTHGWRAEIKRESKETYHDGASILIRHPSVEDTGSSTKVDEALSRQGLCRQA